MSIPFWSKFSIKWKLIIVLLFVALVPMSITLVRVIGILNNGFSLEQQQEGEETIQVVYNLIDSFHKDLRRTMPLLQQNEALINSAYYATVLGNTTELRSVVTSLLEQLSFDMFDVYDLDGAIIAQGHQPEHADNNSLEQEQIQNILENGQTFEISLHENMFSIREFAPLINRGETIGILSLGLSINHEFAQKVIAITGGELSFLNGQKPVASSTPEFEEFCQNMLMEDGDKEQDNVAHVREVDVSHSLYTIATSPFENHQNEVIGTIVVGLENSSLHDIREKTESSIILLAGILMCITLLIGYGLASLVSVPITRLTKIANEIAQGDTEQHVPEIATQDEFGMLSKAFQDVVSYFREMSSAAVRISTGDLSQNIRPRSNRDKLGMAFQEMSAYLREMASVAESTAEGDLRGEVHPKSEHDVLGKAFSNIKAVRETMCQIMDGSQHLGYSSQNLKQISTELLTNAEQGSEGAFRVSESTNQISQNMNEVSIATEELSASIREISRNALEVANIVNTAVEITETTNNTMTDLDSRSQEIGDIVKVIADITQQTNLLALNATIEAARAGDFGKGFTVVAHEIKSLAKETAASAEDITHKIEAIQGSTQDAIEKISEVSNIIYNIHEISNIIATAVGQQTTATNDISRNIANTAEKSHEVNAAFSEVTSIAQSASDKAADVQHASQELAVIAYQLQQLVGKFKI